MPNLRIIMPAFFSPWMFMERLKCSRRTCLCCMIVGGARAAFLSPAMYALACWKIHGFPMQPLATDTIWTPVWSSISKMSLTQKMSPEPEMLKLGVEL